MTIIFDNPDQVAAPIGAYSHSAETPAGSGLIFVSGQVPTNPSGDSPETLAEQADQVYANLVAVLAAKGVAPQSIVKLVTYLVDDDVEAVVPRARAKHLGDHRPASTILYVRALALPQWKIEVEAIALASPKQ
jgi:2-iminobutanoate/2-iminopropanoate deaminase